MYYIINKKLIHNRKIEYALTLPKYNMQYTTTNYYLIYRQYKFVQQKDDFHKDENRKGFCQNT